MALYRILKKEGNFLIDNGCREASSIDSVQYEFPLPWFVDLNVNIPSDLSTKDIIGNKITNASADILTARNQARLDKLSKEAIAKREILLIETDKYMTIDYPLEDVKRDEFVVYRQSLRDITKQSGYPETITWPTKPTE